MSDIKKSKRTKCANFVSHPIFVLSVRTLQFIFAIVVFAALCRSLHLFHGDVVKHEGTKTITDHIRFPDPWGYLLFTAIWTALGVVFIVFIGIRHPIHSSFGYVRVVFEVVALLSWFIGFIASAAYVGQNDCPLEDGVCGSVNLAIAFGTIEAILFLISAPLTGTQVFYPGGFADNNNDHTSNNHITDYITYRSDIRPVQEKQPDASSTKKESFEWLPVATPSPPEKVYGKEGV
ncbi:hypothetical protein HMPREF1624_02235 [Sporothrix schenckii ATCC 58251]|uniref:MARVEL domain-containing protein n=1 Tax=Sporothrix schenckii (strain ATCC 58251 / de Perez 2211183) TaxID=1391915 RepID=U7PZE6_SPOS1|nr:hypothetical protein HMPREF1624_02235 [Sporothrix schenckii ATCC 58251]